jgi:hypothetical protein
MARRARHLVVVTAVLAGVTGCTGETPRPARQPSSPASSASPATSPSAPSSPSTTAKPRTPPRFDAGAAVADVRLLAGRIGPRLATGPSYRRAARVVATRFRELGYGVARQSFPVPAGDSWGVPVRAGRSSNVVATPPGFDPRERHLVVGAHLDSVAVAPGAEDNASGVAVLLELARLAADHPTRLPTVLVAFGAEEPRGPGDALHHFGSRHYVRAMPPRQRRSLVAMASLDRVGVGRIVPVCTGPMQRIVVAREVLRIAGRIGVPARPCVNNASDHWQFEQAGYPAVRFGSTSYAAYHSAADLPRVVSRAQLRRTGRLAWAWLSGRP